MGETLWYSGVKFDGVFPTDGESYDGDGHLCDTGPASGNGPS